MLRRGANNVSPKVLIASPGSIIWAQVQSLWAGRTRQDQSMWARRSALLRAERSISASRYTYLLRKARAMAYMQVS